MYEMGNHSNPVNSFDDYAFAEGALNVKELHEKLTFESLLNKIHTVLKSDKTPFGKVFAISYLVKDEIIEKIPIPGLYAGAGLIPDQVDPIGI